MPLIGEYNLSSSTLYPMFTSPGTPNRSPLQPPPLVSAGTLTQHISVCHSPSASLVYAPVVSSIPCTPIPCTPTPCTPAQDDKFWLHFVKGNISRCTGCGKRDLRGVNGKPKQPPHDLCLRHKEYVIFEIPPTGTHQLSSDLRNVFYHASVRRVTQKHSRFDPKDHVKVSGEVKAKLTTVHLVIF